MYLFYYPELIKCRKIFLKNYEANVSIGVYDVEKYYKQRIIINIDIFIPTSLSTPCKDKLIEVVNYNFLQKIILNRISIGHIYLQETLCDDLLNEILKHKSILASRVSIEKVGVYSVNSSIGVELFKIKSR